MLLVKFRVSYREGVKWLQGKLGKFRIKHLADRIGLKNWFDVIFSICEDTDRGEEGEMVTGKLENFKDFDFNVQLCY